jgi:hypothetical protein
MFSEASAKRLQTRLVVSRPFALAPGRAATPTLAFPAFLLKELKRVLKRLVKLAITWVATTQSEAKK